MRYFQGYFSRTFQDLKLQFPGLFRTKVLFQDFPGPRIFKKKIQDFPGGVGTLCAKKCFRTMQSLNTDTKTQNHTTNRHLLLIYSTWYVHWTSARYRPQQWYVWKTVITAMVD